MANKVLLKKSSVAAKAPTADDLDYGELAINYQDGKLYFKKANNTIDSFSSLSATSTVTSVDGNIGDVTAQQLLDAVKKVDGSGSGLDADLLDGLSSASYAKSGANTDITSLTGLTGAISTADYIDFDSTATVTPQTGRIWWEGADDQKTLSVGMADGVVQQVGQETYFRIKATAPITNGQVVMFTGTVGNSGALTGAPATGLTPETGIYVMGVATQDIPLNGWGYVTNFGLVRGINTTGGGEGWTDGTILYYNPTVTGGLTSTIPTAPNPKVMIAAVVHAASNGSVFVRVNHGSVLGGTDGNVQFGTLANGNLISYNGTASRWENVAQSTITSGDSDKLDGQHGSYYLDWTNTTNKPDPTITANGDASGSVTLTDLASGTLSLTLANSGVTAGTYNNSATEVRPFTVDVKGRVTGIGTAVTITPAWSSITGKPTTLTGYGITDAQPLDGDLTAIAGLTGTTGFLKKTAANTWSLDTNTYLTANQSITISGDASGTGTTSISLTLANSGVTAGTYTKVTVDNKGRVTSGTSLASADLPTYTGTLTSSQITTGLGYTPENSANRGVANGYASLDSGGKVPSTQLPSYVDDVLEYANLAGFPATGESAKIYVALDTNKTYRWSGTAYVEISPSPGTTDSLVEGSTNLYFTTARARSSISATQNITYDSATGVITGPNLSSYLTGNQTITISGDASGSGTTSISLTLANSGVTAGTYTKVTVDAKGRVTTGASLASADLPTYTGTITSSQVTTALGFTPYNSTNPNGYTSNTGTVTSVAAGSYLTGGTITTSGTLAVDATSANTASKVVARDASGNFSAGTITAALSGNASTATKLETARTINGTSFDGSGNITTASWGTARTITIGSTGKSVDGSGNVSWTLADIGAAASTHYHDRIYNGASGSSNSLVLSSNNELEFFNSSGALDVLYLQYSGTPAQLKGPGGAQIWMDSNDGPGSGLDADTLDGNHASAFATASHTHSYLPLSGGTLTGKVTFPAASDARPQAPGGIIGLDSGDGNFDIWGISREYYPSHGTAANAWGIRWYGDGNDILFVGAGINRHTFDLDNGNITITGTLYAASKSFLIDHPTKPEKKLVHGSLEGPEHGVYVRGKLKGKVIELPEYWSKLVDPDSITVQLTPIGKGQKLYVEDIRDNKVYVANDGMFAGEPHCFFFVQGERVDIDKLQVEV